jgi:hypothetical protein
MAEGFKRPGKADYEPPKQTEIRGIFHPAEADLSADTPDQGKSRAQIIVDEYDKTIAFAKWLEGILDDQLKDVVVEVDPEEQPEVWMAMQRIFSTPSPKISYKSYAQVLAALEEVDTVESTVDDPFAEEDEFIAQFTQQLIDKPDELESDTPEMVVDDEPAAPTAPPVISTITPVIKPAAQTLADKLRGSSGN